jgi:phosphopantetheinyl transferase
MPILEIKHINKNVSIGLWRIEENADTLLECTSLSQEERVEFDNIQNVKRKKEWLGARAILFSLCKEMNMKYQGTFKDEHQKPHLIDIPWYISISHSFPYACSMIHKTKPCGIDIERAKPSLFHISKRFLNNEELKTIPRDPLYLCAAWAAKEVLLKIQGRKSLSFKKNLRLTPYNLKQDGRIRGHIKLDKDQSSHILHYFQLNDFIICHSS